MKPLRSIRYFRLRTLPRAAQPILYLPTTLNGVVTPYGANQTVRLLGKTLLTSGSTTTAVVLRVRRASLTGTLVGDQTGQTTITAAADTNVYEAAVTDTPGDVTGFTYVLTAQQTGGGTGGTTVYATLDAFVF